MICLSLPGPTVADALCDYHRLKEKIHCVELRLDLFLEKDIEEFQAQCGHPVIITRSLDEAHHDFQSTPKNVLKNIPQGVSKCAWMAQSVCDSWRVLEAQKSTDIHLMCMGEEGEITRILAPLYRGKRIYAAASEERKTAPGQLTVDELVDSYRVLEMNENTQLVGLIGDPVSESLSPHFHNSYYQKKGLNACYIKMRVRSEELGDIISVTRHQPFVGLSVTMPHKEMILKYVDEIDPEVEKIGAANTLQIRNGKIKAFNTDGKGACDALGAIYGKTMLLLGTGGSARAIAFEAKMRGAQVILWGRTPSKAKQIAKQLSVEMTTHPDVPCDILINATADLKPIPEESIRPNSVVMDIHSYPESLPLLVAASQIGCPTIHGREMFINQALAQVNIFF